MASSPTRIFLLSPARLDGKRAHLLFHPVTMFPVARALHSPTGAPIGEIFAQEVDCTLVLCGNNAVDDPEGEVILETIRSSIDERIVVLTADDPNLVNALQRRAAVVLQKSIREGFGLTVTEAMWKGTAVIGGNVGGIRRQISDGENGFLVDTVDEAAERIVQILKEPNLRQRLGLHAIETVRANFLMSRLMEDWLDLLFTFEQHRQRPAD